MAQSTDITNKNDQQVAGWKDRIQYEMKQKRLSQRKLSGMAGLGATTLRYIMSNADTINVETAHMIANALNIPVKQILTGERIIIEQGGDIQRRISVLRVDDRSDATLQHGVVAIVLDSSKHKDMKAFLQDDRSMEARGNNAPIPADQVIAMGDVVVWSAEVAPKPGSLVVVHEPGDEGSKRLCVRRLVVSDDGAHQAAANNADFGRVALKKKPLGTVLSVTRMTIDQ